MTREEAVKIVGLLVAAYQVPTWSEETVRLWIEELQAVRCDYATALRIVRAWYRSRPRPELHEIIGALGGAGYEQRQRVKLRGHEVLALPSPEERQRRKGQVAELIAGIGRKVS